MDRCSAKRINSLALEGLTSCTPKFDIKVERAKLLKRKEELEKKEKHNSEKDTDKDNLPAYDELRLPIRKYKMHDC